MSRLAEIEQLVVQGKEEQARVEIEQWDTSLVQDGNLHLRLADLCEEVGLPQRLIAELNLALRDEPEETLSLRRLTQAHRDAGRLDRAWRCLKNACQREPGDVQLWLEAVQLLLEMGNRDEARGILGQALQHSQHPELLAQKRLLENHRQDSEDALVGTNSPALLARFQSLFAGREGVYARQWAKDRQNTGYTPVRQPVSHRVIQNHLQGNHTIGVYPIRLDSTVNFVALDLDLPKPFTVKHSPDEDVWQETIGRLHTFAARLQSEANNRGLTTYLEDSGGKGRHLWCFLASPLTARLARKLGQLWAEWAGPIPPDICLELFPKQAQLQPDQLGNLIKLPLGVHRGSGRRGEFLDGKGQPYEDQESFVMSVLRNPKETVHALLCQPTPAWVEDAPELDSPVRESPTPPPPYQPEADLEFQTLMLRCVTLRTLVDQAEAQRSLSHDQVVVLQHTLGYLRQGVEATNHVLALCPEIGANYQLKNPYRGNPMSCARIRARIPGTTSRLDCNCEFPPVTGYPSPVLHLQGPAPEGDESLARALLQDYQRAQRHWQESTRQLMQIQARLQSMRQKGLVQLRQTLSTDQPGCFEID
ncbi:MAG: CRISPR-associated primase-polymerase type A1 [Vulcanimicrobiota bacterium]